MGADAKREARRSEPIHYYFGSNGDGKTLAMVWDTVPSLRAGRPVLSTVRLFDPDRQAETVEEAEHAWRLRGVEDHHRHSNPLGVPHPLYVRWTRWQQLMEWEQGDILMDEAQGVISSRAHHTTPSAVVNQFQQLRRGDICLRATSPAFARVDVAVREVVQAVTWCVGMLREPVPGRMWKSARLFLYRTYNAREYDEWDAARKRDHVKHPRSVRQIVRRKRLGEALEVYDTWAPVDAIEVVNEAGSCLTCGGYRRRPPCTCPSNNGRREVREKAGARR